jgi:hypothetical protein
MYLAVLVVTCVAIGLLLREQQLKARQPQPEQVRVRRPSVRVIPPVFDQDL